MLKYKQHMLMIMFLVHFLYAAFHVSFPQKDTKHVGEE